MTFTGFLSGQLVFDWFNINAQQDFYWIGGDGDWNVASNWSSTSGGAPDKVFSPTQNDILFF